MRVPRSLGVIAAFFLVLAVGATPVGAQSSLLTLLKLPVFSVTFTVNPSCQVLTTEYATQHLVFGHPILSTNVGTVQVTGTGCPTLAGISLSGATIPFTVVDVFNPLKGTVIKSFAIIVAPSLGPLPLPVQAGVNAWQIAPRTDAGYAYAYAGPTLCGTLGTCTSTDYLVVPFKVVALGNDHFALTCLGSTCPLALSDLP